MLRRVETTGPEIPAIEHLGQLSLEVPKFAEPEMFEGDDFLAGAGQERLNSLLHAHPSTVFEHILRRVPQVHPIVMADVEKYAEAIDNSKKTLKPHQFSPDSVLEQLLGAHAEFTFDRLFRAAQTKVDEAQVFGRQIVTLAMRHLNPGPKSRQHIKSELDGLGQSA